MSHQNMPVEWHTLSVEETLKRLGSSMKGLSPEEARERLGKHGYNELRERPGRSVFSMFLDQLREFLVIILILAAIVSGLLGEWLDAGAIIAIVILNALLGTLQEFKAEKAMKALKQLAAPTARVLRGGKESTIPAREVVPGDVLLLEAGDRVPADARLLDAIELRCDESALTGESTPVPKQVHAIQKEKLYIGERANMVFMGTSLTYGRGKAVVVSTGMDTEMGKIAGLIQTTEEEATPLQVRLEQLGKQLGVAFLLISAFVAVAGMLRGKGLLEMFLVGVSLAVAAIPEGLPAIVTITLALGLERMARKKAVVRKLPAVETLGCTSVICSDKTGTLTKNEMTVRRIFCGGKDYEVTGEGYEPKGTFVLDGRQVDPKKDAALSLLLRASVLCNNARLEDGRGWRVIGDPTEGALVVAAMKAGLYQEKLAAQFPRVAELSFDSERKRMSTVHRSPSGLEAYVKGAPEILLGLCTHVFKEGRVEQLTDADRRLITKKNQEMAERALRVLAVAYRPVAEEVKFSVETIEHDLIFLGLEGMMDPPRPEVKKAVEVCKVAGMRPVMITGDHKLTAVAVARELGMLGEGAMVVTGEELDAMSDAELRNEAEHIAVYARVSPEHKQRIVKALKARGAVTAMTGDGVNDAPALKMSDIGVAMGITGTDVAKEAGDMVLLDDNFATIIAAVEEGRVIYDNIKKAVFYLLSCNIGELMVMFGAMLANLPLPLLPLQILWMNLVTDGLPALSLAAEPASKDLMHRPPRSPTEGVITRRNAISITSIALIMALGTLLLFAFELANGPDEVYARTMAFTALVMFQHWFVLSARSETLTLRQLGFFSNKWMVFTFVSTIVMHAAIIYIEPLRNIFKTVPLSLEDWVLITAVSLTAFLVAEIAKVMRRRFSPAL